MKTAKLVLKEISGSGPVKKEKKKGGLLWLWSKIKAPFVGATGGDGAAEGLASRAAEEFSVRTATSVAQGAPILGKIIMAAVATGVMAAGIIATRHLIRSGSVKSSFSGPIASGIRVHRAGPNSLRNAPSGVLGAGANTISAPSAAAGANTVAQNSGKSAVANATNPGSGISLPGTKTPMPGGLGNLAQPALAGGAPIGSGSPMSHYTGQAGQEAALLKSAIARNAPMNVIPMAIATARAGAMAMGSLRGRALGSNSMGGLRGMVGYNQAMQGADYGTAAQNGINQFDNSGIASGGGIEGGGVTSGSPDAASVNPNSNAMGASPGSPTQGDIAQVCTADQLDKGWVSNGKTCVQINTGNTDTTPWKQELQTAKNYIELAAILELCGLLLIWASHLPWCGWLYFIGAALEYAAMGLGAMTIFMATQIGDHGGHFQGLTVALAGILVIYGGYKALNNSVPAVSNEVEKTAGKAFFSQIAGFLGL